MLDFVPGFLGLGGECDIIITGRLLKVIDDYKYSVGRTVVYRHPEPGYSEQDYGQYGPIRTVGVVRAVEIGKPPDNIWVYIIENLRTGEKTRVSEPDIYYATYNRAGRRGRKSQSKIDAEKLAEELTGSATESALANFLRTTVREFIHREDLEDAARREGRNLPLEAGDYIRIRGDLRQELETHHNHYAKILEALEPDIAAIESLSGHYAIRKRYRVLVDDGSEYNIYDPEIKLYYTANGKSTIFNWRAATFLAEAFGDDPPYSLEYSYLEDHVFSRDELESMRTDEIANLLAALLYVKGRMGLRDLQRVGTHMESVPREHLIDSVLAISRFDMRRNRNLTSGEIESKKREIFRFRRLLRGR